MWCAALRSRVREEADEVRREKAHFKHTERDAQEAAVTTRTTATHTRPRLKLLAGLGWAHSPCVYELASASSAATTAMLPPCARALASHLVANTPVSLR